jgi:myo-inositol-1(or 4)-monophosphatase
MEDGAYRDFIARLLRTASAVAMDSFGKVKGSTKAGDPNQVLTETDLKIAQLVTEEIKRCYPKHNIIDEETGVVDNGSPYTWVVDPIDGTSNFAARVPLFGIMLGLLFVDAPIAGGVALPAFDMISIAEKGKGAHCGSEPIWVSASDQLQDSLIAYGIDSNQADPAAVHRECVLLGRLVSKIGNLRSSNSAFDLVMVAHGNYGACLNRSCRIWDVVAPQLLIEEAGGVYTTFDGKPMDYSEPTRKAIANFTFCAAAPALHYQLQALLASLRAIEQD